uniref:Uncharacterized protein n=1 Tax=Streptococcus thermophilus TaxID=1308 RepID=Q1WCQ7_STRTR|nr:hypothetical protein [Streptococcus thermophilus]
MFCNSTIKDLFLFVFTQLILHYRMPSFMIFSNHRKHHRRHCCVIKRIVYWWNLYANRNFIFIFHFYKNKTPMIFSYASGGISSK